MAVRIAGHRAKRFCAGGELLLADAVGHFQYGESNRHGFLRCGGQPVDGGGQHFTYDAENRITKALQPGIGYVDYGYDGNGRRVFKSNSYGSRTIYVYDAEGKLVVEYSLGVGSVSPCQTCYLSLDHLGSTRLVTDQAGNTVSRHDYTPFGEEIQANSGGRDGTFGTQDFVNQKFTGKERDQETGLDYFGARYYGSALGRFTSVDPGNASSSALDPRAGICMRTLATIPCCTPIQTDETTTSVMFKDRIAVVSMTRPGPISGTPTESSRPVTAIFQSRMITEAKHRLETLNITTRPPATL
ncbi:MAG TPA: RHS repeat-associated core domain-containing protein [Bryobacteraceae bacterium]|nr:RHS repeat-associated core domain-containing protein [Bryobacteraceae bacterium]